MLALALCSTNMPLQTIFAEEFTSENPDVVSEEIPEIFTNEEQEAVGETDEELSAFGSEEIPEFNDAPDEAMAAAENARIKEIDLINSNEVINGVYTISSAGDYKFTCSNRQETANRIVVDGKNTSEQDNINIYLDNVNIKTSAGSALQIQRSVKTQVYIYLEGINKLNSGWNAALQKDNAAKLTIDNSPNTTGELIAISSSGAGIGGGNVRNRTKITISGGSVNAQIDCRPHKNLDSSGNYDQYSPNVYLCTIPNEGNDPITIDDTPWSPYSHIAVDPDEKKLYAWLTGETHTISVGNTTQTYYFDKTNQKFQPITNKDFTFTEPSNLTYNG